MIINGQDIKNVAVIGLGLTGRSCASFLLKQNITPTLIDTRDNLDSDNISQEFEQAKVILGSLDNIDFSVFDMLVVSPGISINHPALIKAKNSGCLIVGDIELFAHFVKVPVIAITGSNGKTTVTSLLTEMAIQSGIKAVAAGNIGLPVLDVVLDETIELFILELSSFQLETTHNLSLIAATVLNISDDHMDRYNGLNDYALAKQRIYKHCKKALVNRQDELTLPVLTPELSFGLDEPQSNEQFGLANGYLMQGNTQLMAVDDMAMVGQHNQLNALAAIALGLQVDLPLTKMLSTLKSFSGLEHRCQKIPSDDGILWLNDSKATNVGATLAALEGLKSYQGNIIVIAGGDAKGGDLTPLKLPFETCVSELIVMGQDAPLFVSLIPSAHVCNSMADAVVLASSLAQQGDIVLLSPACASIDMFDNYMQRGQQFIDAIGRLHEC